MTSDTVLTTFKSLGLTAEVLRVLEVLGYEEPTPIQIHAIPPLLTGRDVLGSAATGTGKTAAFALPLVERLEPKARGVQALIMTPTRELAMQVAEAVHRYGRHRSVTVLPIYGGQPIQRQLVALKRGVQVVVGTPGRLLDHIRRGSLELSGVRYVVLDEADEMLDMGFIEDIEAILNETPEERQTACFSATFPPRINELVRRHLKEPERVTIKAEVLNTPRVRQVAYVVPRPQKLEALGRILDLESPASAIIFCRTRTEVDELAEAMAGHGYSVEALHGGFAQVQRDRVMSRFREGTADLLIATDVAARGLDIQQVSHVINYDIPGSPDVYVHRIGRTGRAGREGTAITLVQPREHGLLKAIEKVVKQRIEPGRIPSAADVKARRIEALTAALRETLVESAFDSYRVAIQSLAEEYDALDIAAAAAKLAAEAIHGDEPEASVAPAPRERDRARAEEQRVERKGVQGKRGEGQPRDGSRPPRRRADGMVRLVISLPDQSGIRPKDIVGAIANEAGIPGDSIGSIEIGEKRTLVEVPESAADKVIRALARTTIKGQRVTARRAD
ncbi:MAG: DEAD/DEAH box helicase [Burkholderiales bacterium]